MPSKAQSEAISHVDGPAILIAGPGSGKTFTIVKRLQYLIKRARVIPDNILVVTFSKAAAHEMQERFLQESDEYGVHFGTFHSIAYYILRDSFNFNTNSLLSDSEKRNMLSMVLKNHGFNICNNEVISTVLDDISKSKNSSSYKELNLISKFEEIPTTDLNEIVNDYYAFKNELNKIDYDDMIIICLDKLNKNPDLLSKYQKQFRYILVDEFQDINKPQYDLIRLLCKSDNLFVVGDDDQAIYGFRGSSPGIMFKFLDDYKEAKTIMLTDNYRCGSKIVDFATKVIGKNPDRFSKTFNPINNGGNVYFKQLESRQDEEKYIVNILNDMSLEDINETAIILRTNMEIKLYSYVLKNNNIPVKQIRNSNMNKENRIIEEDIISFLCFVYEGNNRSFFIKFMNKPNKYIRSSALVSEKVNPEDLYRYYSNNHEMVALLNDFFNKIELAKKLSPNLAISIFRKTLGYDKHIKSISKNDLDYKSNLASAQRLEELFKEYSFGSKIIDFYENTIKTKKDNEISNETGVSFHTMHTAKGLEFKNVILPDINEGVIPGKRSNGDEVVEERRLLYVAITRAKENLYIISNNERNRKISRFIKGIVKE